MNLTSFPALTDNRLIIIGLAAAVVLGGVIFVLLRNRKIRSQGIEAKAVVVRIEEESDYASDFEHSTDTKTVIAEYVDAEGRLVTAVLVNPPARCEVGTELRIKYLPGKPEHVLYIRE